MYISVILYYLDTIKHNLDLRRCFGIPPFLSAALNLFYCNLSDTAAKMLDTFTCKGAEKHREREWTVNEIL